MQYSAEFEAKLASFVTGCDKIAREHKDRNFPSLQHATFSIERGKKYIRIVRADPHRSVHCFIDSTNGDVLKSASWKVPAKHARGNIFAEDNGLNCMGPYGAAYLRG